MAIKVAINGYGRIGRNVLRALYESGRNDDIRIVAVNDLGDAETNAHLTQYDTAHGKFPGEVAVEGGDLVVNGDRIKVCAERDPSKLPWGELGVDVVLECTGLFTQQGQGRRAPGRRRQEGHHLRAGRQGHRRHLRLRRQPRQADRRPPGHLQRQLHHQLPGAAGQGAATTASASCTA